MELVCAYAIRLGVDTLALWLYSTTLEVGGVGMGLYNSFRGVYPCFMGGWSWYVLMLIV
ncbi:hypothetical protein [Psychrobacillus sp. L3]|uniref:hypothetical protein n=1 Tax=Psychrobacillus sp. L3 TaxID=3236891 RepID=UPI0036F3EAB3